MCGITGYLGDAARGESERRDVLVKMTSALSHRGPDAAGYWCDPAQQIHLGHRRLAIVDLSAAGQQPMISASGRYVLVFNGEIYNHLELRRELGVDDSRAVRTTSSGEALERLSASREWRGHSDTETLLEGIDRWGLRHLLSRAVGMFAFAVWDREQRQISLARDRLGEKPLYYGWQADTFIFGSELKALKCHPRFVGRIDRRSVSQMLRYQCVPAPRSIFEGIKKLRPGCLVTVSLGRRSEAEEPFWSVGSVVARSRLTPFEGSERDATNRCEVLLRRAVSSQMMSDVPLGAFLSGGVDSSTIVALMQAQSVRPVQTFTIGFAEKDFDESRHAAAVARHLGTNHTAVVLSAKDALEVIPELPRLYDEPFSDSSQIPTFLVSRLARSEVTVALSGDGGDEVFGGYNRYQLAGRYWNLASSLPLNVRKRIAGLLERLTEDEWDVLFSRLGRFFPAAGRVRIAGHRIRKGAAVLTSQSAELLYRGLVSHWTDGSGVVRGVSPDGNEEAGAGTDFEMLSSAEKMMALDLATFLPDDILVKVDRAGMGVSLETRMPFLDHRVVEFAWSLPLSMKLGGGITKRVLRQVLYRYVPADLIERPKAGFGMPITDWLRGPLREWAEDMLDESRLKQDGILEVELVRRRWTEHLERRQNWQYHLWDVLMFQAWLSERHSNAKGNESKPITTTFETAS